MREADFSALAQQLWTKLGFSRVFPFSQRRAVAVRGSPESMAAAETLVARVDAGER